MGGADPRAELSELELVGLRRGAGLRGVEGDVGVAVDGRRDGGGHGFEESSQVLDLRFARTAPRGVQDDRRGQE